MGKVQQETCNRWANRIFVACVNVFESSCDVQCLHAAAKFIYACSPISGGAVIEHLESFVRNVERVMMKSECIENAVDQFDIDVYRSPYLECIRAAFVSAPQIVDSLDRALFQRAMTLLRR